MEYNFDQVIDRRHTNSYKWEVEESELAMWVADMDFQTAPCIRKVLKERVEHGIFGYSELPSSWNEAYVNWWKNRHGLTIHPDSLVFCTGVIPAISTAVRKLTTPAEKVLIQTPVYNIFFNSIINNGRYVVENELVYDGTSYSIDFALLEEQLSDPQVTLMLLCNPQNPAGIIWDRETLARIGALCKQYGVTVVSDEIHCDLCDPGYEYIPFASVNEINRDISVTCVAPTKAFNIAGIQTAAVFAENKTLRHKMWRGLNTDEVAEPNAFAVDVTVAAFNEGGVWLDALREYLYGNKQYVREFIDEMVPEIKVVPSNATYLLWLDCSALTEDADALCAFIREKTGLYMAKGSQYGTGGRCFIRLNIACPRVMVADGMDRLSNGVLLWKKEKGIQ